MSLCEVTKAAIRNSIQPSRISVLTKHRMKVLAKAWWTSQIKERSITVKLVKVRARAKILSFKIVGVVRLEILVHPFILILVNFLNRNKSATAIPCQKAATNKIMEKNKFLRYKKTSIFKIITLFRDGRRSES